MERNLGGQLKFRKTMTSIVGAGGLVAVLAGCQIGAMGVVNTPSITVSKHVDKGPDVVAHLNLRVEAAPRGGTVVMTLNYYSPGAKKWEFAGRSSVGNPWHQGQDKNLNIVYPCLRSGLRWRIYVVWDGHAADGKPSSGSAYWPNKTIGKKLAC
jgi:hypothetical protein